MLCFAFAALIFPWLYPEYVTLVWLFTKYMLSCIGRCGVEFVHMSCLYWVSLRSCECLCIVYAKVFRHAIDSCNLNQVELLPVDRLKVLKQQIIEQSGFDNPQLFPLFEDRFPTQVVSSKQFGFTVCCGLEYVGWSEVVMAFNGLQFRSFNCRIWAIGRLKYLDRRPRVTAEFLWTKVVGHMWWLSISILGRNHWSDNVKIWNALISPILMFLIHSGHKGTVIWCDSLLVTAAVDIHEIKPVDRCGSLRQDCVWPGYHYWPGYFLRIVVWDFYSLVVLIEFHWSCCHLSCVLLYVNAENIVHGWCLKWSGEYGSKSLAFQDCKQNSRWISEGKYEWNFEANMHYLLL